MGNTGQQRGRMQGIAEILRLAALLGWLRYANSHPL
jgi:hypothetical protein